MPVAIQVRHANLGTDDQKGLLIVLSACGVASKLPTALQQHGDGGTDFNLQFVPWDLGSITGSLTPAMPSQFCR